ncbi:MAG: agmatinase [Halobacteria archaeon]|nr:agmatinase [Halobacteria archaeon]
MLFADADADYDNAEFAIAGIPLEVTTSFRRGTKFAPAEIRRASHNFEPYMRAQDVNLGDISIHDYGDIDVWSQPREVVEFASGVVGDFADDSKIPVVLGGEHTVSVAGFNGSNADAFVAFDAHLDMKDEYEGRMYNHASVSRLAAESGLDVFVIGVRSGSRDEYEYADWHENIRYIEVDGFDGTDVVDEIGEYDAPYLSIDLDVFDPGFAPGVGTPEPFGLNPTEVRNVIRGVATDCVGFDVVELCPAHDDGTGMGTTAFLGAKLVREFVASASADSK